MRDTKNVEGMTFEEWVCAAGRAKVNDYGVRPYTESQTWYTWRNHEWCGRSKQEGIRHRSSSTNYPKELREAWKQGVDPTEFRT